jgi:ABC-2 type transport system permease protein
MSERDLTAEPWSPGPLPAPAASVHRASPVRTLPLRVEFARQLSQWRVRGVLVVLAVLPVVIRLAFLIGGRGSGGSGGGTQGGGTPGGADLAAFAQASGTTFTAFVLVITGGFLLTLVVALLFGDMIAGEASRSTLKYLLTIPVGRTRLLAVKVFVSATVLVVGVLLLAGMSLLVGTISYGTGGIQVPVGPQLEFGESLVRILAAVALICLHLSWAAALGTLLTVYTDAPLAAAGGVVLTSIISSILERIEDLGDARAFLPTFNTDAFRQFFAARIDYGPIADSVLSALVYSLVFTVVAVVWFRRKNISS